MLTKMLIIAKNWLKKKILITKMKIKSCFIKILKHKKFDI